MLRLIPLGGLGEFGLNAMVLESNGDRILIDCGLMFPTAQMPGVGVVWPDLSLILNEPEKLKAVFLTHGHEDHVGALSSLLERMNVPVYGLPLTLGIARNRVEEAGIAPDFRAIGPREPVKAGNAFQVEYARVVHSMPDAAALCIRTPEGTVIHTGDFKLEDDPIDGLPADLERLGEYGDEGVLALLSDSTGAEYERPTAPERDVAHTFEQLFPKAKGRIIIAMFASHLLRIRHTLELCARLGRKVVLAGRTLSRNIDLARQLGILKIPDDLIIPAEDSLSLPDSKVVILATGSQAEPRSALMQMAQGTWIARSVPFVETLSTHAHAHGEGSAETATPAATVPGNAPALRIHAGDTVILSARPIPGNERMIGSLIDALLSRGATVFHGSANPGVHVSGHATAPQQRQMIQTVRPKHFIPIHGELRQLYRHLQVARDTGVIPNEGLLLARDGEVLEFADGLGRHAGEVEIGRIFRDRWGDGEMHMDAIAEREKLAELGIIAAALVIDPAKQRIVSGPHLTGRGLAIEESANLAEVAKEAREALEQISPPLLGDDAFVREELSRTVRRALKQRTGKRSAVLPLVVKL